MITPEGGEGGEAAAAAEEEEEENGLPGSADVLLRAGPPLPGLQDRRPGLHRVLVRRLCRGEIAVAGKQPSFGELAKKNVYRVVCARSNSLVPSLPFPKASKVATQSQLSTTLPCQKSFGKLLQHLSLQRS